MEPQRIHHGTPAHYPSGPRARALTVSEGGSTPHPSWKRGAAGCDRVQKPARHTGCEGVGRDRGKLAAEPVRASACATRRAGCVRPSTPWGWPTVSSSGRPSAVLPDTGRLRERPHERQRAHRLAVRLSNRRRPNRPHQGRWRSGNERDPQYDGRLYQPQANGDQRCHEKQRPQAELGPSLPCPLHGRARLGDRHGFAPLSESAFSAPLRLARRDVAHAPAEQVQKNVEFSRVRAWPWWLEPSNDSPSSLTLEHSYGEHVGCNDLLGHTQPSGYLSRSSSCRRISKTRSALTPRRRSAYFS